MHSLGLLIPFPHMALANMHHTPQGCHVPEAHQGGGGGPPQAAAGRVSGAACLRPWHPCLGCTCQPAAPPRMSHAYASAAHAARRGICGTAIAPTQLLCPWFDSWLMPVFSLVLSARPSLRLPPPSQRAAAAATALLRCRRAAWPPADYVRLHPLGPRRTVHLAGTPSHLFSPLVRLRLACWPPTYTVAVHAVSLLGPPKFILGLLPRLCKHLLACDVVMQPESRVKPPGHSFSCLHTTCTWSTWGPAAGENRSTPRRARPQGTAAWVACVNRCCALSNGSTQQWPLLPLPCGNRFF